MAILKMLPRHEYVKDADGNAVRREVTEWPTGAYCDLAYKPGRITGRRWSSNPDDYVVLVETHAGLCLFETRHPPASGAISILVCASDGKVHALAASAVGGSSPWPVGAVFDCW